MKRNPARTRALGFAVIGGLACLRAVADTNVIVSALANPEYTARKFGEGKTTPETYVVMQGHYFDGYVADSSLERIPFRRIAEIFAPELAKRNYWPARTTQEADLLIVVHWGTTAPPVSRMEMTARSNPLPDVTAARQNQAMRAQAAAQAGDVVGMLLAELMNEEARLMQMEQLERVTDAMSMEGAMTRSAQLLGYTNALQRYSQRETSSAEEESLRLDLTQLRYFIVLRAYDLHGRTREERGRPVWTLHLNVSSAGNNFQTALDRMSTVAADYLGRTTDRVETVRSVPEGKVTIGPVTSHGEAK